MHDSQCCVVAPALALQLLPYVWRRDLVQVASANGVKVKVLFMAAGFMLRFKRKTV
jgi:hypothetical protein